MLKYILGAIFAASFILYFLIFGAYNELDALRFDMIGTVNKLKIDFFAPYNKDLLQKKIEEPPPSWAKKQINTDLSKTCGVSEKDIDVFFDKLGDKNLQKYGLVKIKIKENSITTFPENIGHYDRRRRSLVESLKILAMETSLPNLSFIVCVHDFINPTLDFNIPIFASSKDISKDTRKNIILIPDGNNLARWKHSITSIYYADKAYNWEEKDNEIFWRGQIKGKTRKKIIKLAEKHPFINAKHASKSEEGYIIPELQIKHKYLLSLDSYGPSLTGFLWKLASNSVVIKQDSTYIQWYYAAMKPWVHYVPIKSDLSNIEEVFAQITKQDKKVKKIAIKSNEFVYKNLTYEDMLVYIYHALKVYKIRCYS